MATAMAMARAMARARAGGRGAMAMAMATAAGAALVLLGGCASGPRMETVIEMEATPGNVAVSPDGRIFASLHPFGEPEEERVVEILEDEGRTRPFPPGWSGPRPTGPDADPAAPGIASIIGIEADSEGRLWMLDMGGERFAPRLIGWDLAADELVAAIDLGSVAKPASFMQDLAVDVRRDRVYIADAAPGADDDATGRPAIVVVDLATQRARRVLEGHRSVMPEDVDMVVDGRVLTLPGPDGEPVPARVGVNPIELGPDGDVLYWGAMNGTVVWRIDAALLADLDAPPDVLARAVERHGDKPVSDGFGVAADGGILVTHLGADAIGVTSPDGTYDRIHGLPPMSWPDGMAGGPDGWFLVTVNQLHRHPALAGGRDLVDGPMRIVRIRVPGLRPVVGR